MNASPYHSKVKVPLKFADTQFAAGGMVTGKAELECKAEKGLGISVIMVELFAIEGQYCLYALLSIGREPALPLHPSSRKTLWGSPRS